MATDEILHNLRRRAKRELFKDLLRGTGGLIMCVGGIFLLGFISGETRGAVVVPGLFEVGMAISFLGIAIGESHLLLREHPSQ